MQIRIPAEWPPCPAKWADRRVKPDGTIWDEGEPPAPTKVPGGSEGVDRINVTDGDSGVLTWVLIGGAAIAAAVIGMKVVGKKRR